MKKNTYDAEREYFIAYVNYGHEAFTPAGKAKREMIMFFCSTPIIGLLITLADWVNPIVFRTVFLVILFGGIFCAAASDRWFSGNRWYLFRCGVWLVGGSINFGLIGILFVYGISKLLGFIFVVVYIVFAIAILFLIVTRISKRKPLKTYVKGNIDHSIIVALGGFGGYFGGVVFCRVTESIDEDITGIIVASLSMMLATLFWVGVEIFFKLSFAIKYDIDVIVSK